jgi:hypothetical protein
MRKLVLIALLLGGCTSYGPLVSEGIIDRQPAPPRPQPVVVQARPAPAPTPVPTPVSEPAARLLVDPVTFKAGLDQMGREIDQQYQPPFNVQAKYEVWLAAFNEAQSQQDSCVMATMQQRVNYTAADCMATFAAINQVIQQWGTISIRDF